MDGRSIEIICSFVSSRTNGTSILFCERHNKYQNNFFFFNTNILFWCNFEFENLFLFHKGCQIFAKSDGDPIEKFENGDKADAEGDSSDTPDIGGKVNPGHLFRS